MADYRDPDIVFRETKSRIQEDIDHFRGRLPERTALVWDGFIAALLEYGLLSVGNYERLSNMLPKIADNPVIDVFRGRDV